MSVQANLNYLLAGTDRDIAGWALGSGALANRVGTRFEGPLTFVSSAAPALNLNDGRAFLVEAIVWADDSLIADGADHPAGIRIVFTEGPATIELKVRLLKVSAAVHKVILTEGGVDRCSIDLDWHLASPGYRVRVKRQLEAGSDYIYLQAEPRGEWDTSPMSQRVLVSTLAGTSMSPPVVELGNFAAPAGVKSYWENIHVAAATDGATVLPYRPPAGPTPTLAFHDLGADVLQCVDMAINCAGITYLPTDALGCVIVPTVDLKQEREIAAPSNTSALVHFDSLGDAQSVTGYVVAREGLQHPAPALRPVPPPPDIVRSAAPSASSAPVVIPDRTSPVLSALSLNQATFSRQPGNNQIVLELDCSEDLGSIAVRIDGQPLVVSPYSPTSPSYTATYDVSTTPLGEGPHTITVDGSDAAGNPAAQQTIQCTFDFTPPVLQNVTTNGAVFSRVAGHNQVTVTFDLTGHTALAVTIGGVAMAFVTNAGSTFTYAHDIPGSGGPLGEGDHDILIAATDALGNQATAVVTVALDFTAPGGTIHIRQKDSPGTDSAPLPRYNGVTEPVAIVLDVADAHFAAALSELVVNGAAIGLGPYADPLVAGRYVVPAPAFVQYPALNTIVANLVDAAGNANLGALPTDFDLDSVAPTGVIKIRPVGGAWADLTGNPTLVAGARLAIVIPHDHVGDLDFPVSGSGPTHLVVDGTVHALNYDDFIHSTSGTDEWFELDMLFGANGPHTVSAHLQDLFGNVTDLGPLTFDLDIPLTGTLRFSETGVAGTFGAFPATTYTLATFFVAVDVPVSNLQLDQCRFHVTGNPDSPFNTLPAAQPEGDAWRTILGPISAPDGLVTVSVDLRDQLGHVNAAAIQASFDKDTLAPGGELQVSSGTSGWSNLPPGSTLTLEVQSCKLRADITSGLADLDTTASYIEVEKAGDPAVRKTFSQLAAGNEWPTAIRGRGAYTMRLNLVDDNGNANPLIVRQLALNPPDFYLQKSGVGASASMFISHTHDDGTDLDPAGLFLDGPASDNYIGTCIFNEAGAGRGDCRYRTFCIPACLFTGTSEWRLIDDGAAAAPLVQDILPGTGKVSTANRNFNRAHPEFPSKVTEPAFWATYAVGDILHTCTCVVIHGTEDPLLLPDGLGGMAPIDDAQFNDAALFRSVVMTKIDQYNGTTGSYWTAVTSNRKIANRNFNIKNVV